MIRHLWQMAFAVALLGALAPAILPAAARPQARPGSQATTQPATRPATQPEGADAAMDRLLKPATQAAGSPASEPALSPGRFAGAPDNSTGRGAAAIAPDTPRQPLAAEGTYVIDRLVHARPSVDGRGLEVAFAVDGQAPAAAVDPPMLLAPNLSLMALEEAVREDPERQFRLTGRVSEYRGRNYLLLEKVVVVR